MSIRILLIEDESRIADFLIRGLTEEGYTLEHVHDGALAWPRLQNEAWDLVLLDWWLPGQDGIQLLRQFRLINRRTPVLFLTARDAVSERVQGLDAGADDYLCKPFSFEELLARIRALIRRYTASSGLTLEYADIQADLRNQRAARAGQTLELTAKEFSLLVCFLHRPETVMSRSRLYEIVWKEIPDIQSNTLEVHIKELRRKLEQFGPRIIHTRRGSGYVLDRTTFTGDSV